MSWVILNKGKLEPMSAEVTSVWTQAIRQGVRALGFSLVDVVEGQWMAAEVDKEIAHSTKTTQIVMARALLMAKLEESPATSELRDYQDLLAIEVIRRVAPDPLNLLAALAEPYE